MDISYILTKCLGEPGEAGRWTSNRIALSGEEEKGMDSNIQVGELIYSLFFGDPETRGAELEEQTEYSDSKDSISTRCMYI
jgi:hypothetical protein